MESVLSNRYRCCRNTILFAVIAITLNACGGNHDNPALDDPAALSPEQLAALPGDCVLAIRPGAEALCYSPGTMMLSEVKRDGEFTWQQLLEGDPNTLRVSAVVPMEDAVLLVASTYDDIGLWQHVLLRYMSDGTYQKSVSILGPFRELVDGGRVSVAWNVTGEPLRITFDDKALFILAPIYTRLPGTVGTRVEDWLATGRDSLTRIEPASGKRLAYRGFDSRVSDGPPVLDNESVRLSIGTTSQAFDSNTLADRAVPATGPTLRRGTVPLLMPTLYSWADGTRMSQFELGVSTVLSGAGQPATPSDPPCRAAGGEDLPGCTGMITVGPVTLACDLSGTAIHTWNKETAYVADEGVRLVSNSHRVTFDECRVSVPESTALAEGEYTVSGEYQLDRNDTYSLADVTYAYENTTLRAPGGHVEQITANVHELTYLGSTGSRTRTTNIATATSGDEIISNLDVKNVNAYTHAGSLSSVYGTLIWRNALANGEAIDVNIDPTLSASWPYRGPGTPSIDGSRILMSGTLKFRAIDGSALWISVEEHPSDTGSYRLRYELPGDGTVFHEPFESLLVPFYSD